MKDVVLNEIKDELNLKERIAKEVKELSFKYCKSEKYVLLLYKICLDFNVNNCNEEIVKFLEK